MKTKFTKKELLELEVQLSNPTGKKGIEVAKKMHERNFSMTKSTIDMLDIQPNNKILEIGHGNCEHLSYILKQKQNISYTGLEISETMQKMAQQKLKNLITSLTVNFDLYDGKNIMYPSNSFDRIFTVNTIYFWKKPDFLLNQIARVLKPKGRLVITFANKDFMKKLPFVKDKFELYDKISFQKLLKETSFHIEDCIENKEEILSKTNEKVIRNFLFYILKKSH